MSVIDKLKFEDKDLIENNATRIAVCLIVDTSMTMIMQDKIGHLNRGVQKFIQDCSNDEYAVDSIDLCIIACQGEKPRMIHSFSNVASIRYKDIEAKGQTPLGASVLMGLQEIQKRMETYRNYGKSSYRPWLILMSDGKSSDDITKASKVVLQQVQNRKLKVGLIDMSNGQNENDLRVFTKDGNVQSIDILHIEQFFTWLSRSVAEMSSSVPGEEREALDFN